MNSNFVDSLTEAWTSQLSIHCPLQNNLHLESERLRTFANWSNPFADKRELAMLGFYFLEPPDCVQCVFCGVSVRSWEPDDDVLIGHFEFSPECPLLKLSASKNVPIEPERLDKALLSAYYETCKSCGSAIQIIEKSGRILRTHAHNFGNSSDVSFLYDVADEESSEPVSSIYPQYEMDDARFDTFDIWPTSSKKNPEDLCDAGFFYSGNDDEVTCFYCGGSVMNWKEEDNIWEVHASRFSHCEYVRFVKGDKFVEDITIRDCQNTDVSGSSSQSTASAVQPRQNQKLHSTHLQTPTAPDGKTCKICYDNDYDTVFVPCGHVMACNTCASSVKDCPLCRKPIKAVTKLFFC